MVHGELRYALLSELMKRAALTIANTEPFTLGRR